MTTQEKLHQKVNEEFSDLTEEVKKRIVNYTLSELCIAHLENVQLTDAMKWFSNSTFDDRRLVTKAKVKFRQLISKYDRTRNS